MTTEADPSPRSAGVLLHPSSLPGPHGIGDLGTAAHAWVDALAKAKQTWWQILPLGPTGYGDSPYQCFSAFAGNSYLISPQALIEDGLLDARDVAAVSFPANRVDFGPVIPFKIRLLNQAWENFQRGRAPALKAAFDAFVQAETAWLDDYALFMALKDAHQGRSWQEWPAAAHLRQSGFIKKAAADHAKTIGRPSVSPVPLHAPMAALENLRQRTGIQIIGDIPIFVSGDSADVWANPQLFALDAERAPEVVAGVPPDYFSADRPTVGQPALRLARHAGDRFRLVGRTLPRRRSTSSMSCVSITSAASRPTGKFPPAAPTPSRAVGSRPRRIALLAKLKNVFGKLPIIAEDLGVITPEVDAMRRRFDLPGMRILQFAFADNWENRFLPHNYDCNTVVYTGTHDNDTTWGWYRTAPEHEHDHARRYLARDGSDAAWDLIRAAWSSVAYYAIAPLQDVLNLGTEARMNFPGKPQGNWAWRFQTEQFNPWALERLAEMTELYGRAKIEK